jgi:uncharacterized protein
VEDPKPRLIVADAGPLIVLSRLGELAFLQRLFGRVCVTQVVHAELFSGGSFRGQAEITGALSNWLDVAHVEMGTWTPRCSDLDLGEASSICLAERHPDSLLIIDDHTGRQEATSRGLRFIGLLAVLLEVKRRGLVPQLRPLLDGLRREGYYLGEPLILRVLAAAGE